MNSPIQDCINSLLEEGLQIVDENGFLFNDPDSHEVQILNAEISYYVYEKACSLSDSYHETKSMPEYLFREMYHDLLEENLIPV